MNFEKISRFFALSCHDKMAFIEALFFLLISKLIVITMPFRKAAQLMGALNVEPVADITQLKPAKSARVKLFVAMGAANVPWNSVCLDQALAGAFMLQRRHIPYGLCIGVKRDLTEDKLRAHAWILCGGKILIGGIRSLQFTRVAVFSKDFR